MATAPKFRIDVDIHNLLMHSETVPVQIPKPTGLTLPEPVFPRYPEKLADPAPEAIPGKARLDVAAGVSQHAGMAVSVCEIAGVAGGVSSDHGVSICRVQVQSRLLVLLGL